MKRLILIFAIFFYSCSFDNKTGIWKDASEFPVYSGSNNTINDEIDNQYEQVFTNKKTFYEEKNIANNIKLVSDPAQKNTKWLQEFGNNYNNISNFSFKNNKILAFKSKKLSKFSHKRDQIYNNLIFFDDKVISYDHKGTIFIYSILENKKIFEFNFYQKKFKKYLKELYMVLENSNLYIADNLGYMYVVDIENNNVKWAKNFGIPFRSNIKIFNNQIFLANQDNILYSVNSTNGNINWQFASNIILLKSEFKNNIALDEAEDNLLFLNTAGQLYSLNYISQRINWVLNFKSPTVSTETNLFISHPIVIKNDNLIVSTENALSNYDVISGNRKWSFSLDPFIKPIITSNYVFSLTENNLLVCIDIKTGEVLWSKNIFIEANDEKKINKIGKITSFNIADGDINLFSGEGYVLSFNFGDGTLKYFEKLSKNGISSQIIYANDKMYLFDNNNKLLKFN